MDFTPLITAIVAGAALATKETTSQAIKDSYGGLKEFLMARFKIGSIAAVEKDPTVESFKAALSAELDLSPEIANDPEVSKLLLSLLSAIDADQDNDHLKSVGIEVGVISSTKNTIIRSIQGFETGLNADRIESGEDTVIEGIVGKP